MKRPRLMKFFLFLFSCVFSTLLLFFSYRQIFPNVAIKDLPPPRAVFLKAGPIQDPILGLIMPPWAPDHDYNGFRNVGVPDLVDVLVIGDSQTWGNNAIRSQDWPSQYQQLCHCTVYNTGMGGFGPAQYYAIAMRFLKEMHPKTLIVAMYLGNDIMEAYLQTYLSDYYRKFRKEGWRYSGQLLKIWNEPSSKPQIAIRYGDMKTFLTPDTRFLTLDLRSPEISEGLRLTDVYLSEIAQECSKRNIRLTVALIRTKESVYRGTSNDSMLATENAAEDKVCDHLKAFFEKNQISYIDTLSAMMANRSRQLYPDNGDGHPIALGYQILSEAIFSGSQKKAAENLTRTGVIK